MALLSRKYLELLGTFEPHRSNDLSTHKSSPPVIHNSVCVVRFIPEPDIEECDRELEELDKSFKNPNAFRKMNNDVSLLKLMGTSGGAFSYRKPRFPAATVRFRSIKNNVFTIQVFPGGKCPVVGCSCIEQVNCTVQQFRFYLQSRGIHVRVGEISMSNVVCSGFVGYPIDIEQFQQLDPIGNVKIHESFPGIMRVEYTEHGVPVQFLIFDSGRYIAMGLSDASDEAAREAFDLIEPRLRANRLKVAKPVLTDDSLYRNTLKSYRTGSVFTEVTDDLVTSLRGRGRGRGGRGGRGRGGGRRAPAAPRKRKRDSSIYIEDAKHDLALLQLLQ